MKKISLFVVLASVMIYAAEYGVKLRGSQACVKACGVPVMALTLVPDSQRLTGSRLAGASYACAINMVGRQCLEKMRNIRSRDRHAKRRKRNGETIPVPDYLAIDYLGCIYSEYNPQIEPCIYRE